MDGIPLEELDGIPLDGEPLKIKEVDDLDELPVKGIVPYGDDIDGEPCMTLFQFYFIKLPTSPLSNFPWYFSEMPGCLLTVIIVHDTYSCSICLQIIVPFPSLWAQPVEKRNFMKIALP